MTQSTYSVSPQLSVCLKPGAPTPAFRPSGLGDTHPPDVARASRLRVMAPSRCQSPTFGDNVPVLPVSRIQDVTIFVLPTQPLLPQPSGQQNASFLHRVFVPPHEPNFTSTHKPTTYKFFIRRN